MEILTKYLPFFRLTLFLLCLPVFGYAQQFPVNNQKIVQGVGTAAQGIISYSSLPPTTNPSASTWRHVTSMHVDTVERVQYIYKRPRWYAVSFLLQSNPPPATESSGSTTVDYTETIWQNTTDSTSYYFEEKNQCWQPVGTVVRDTTPVSTAATGTSAAVCYEYSLWYNSTNDSLYAYTAGDWLAIGSGGGGTAGAVDSIVVLQDSIIVGYSEGVEVTRDTIGFPGTDIADIPGLADSLASHPSGTGTNNYLPKWTGSNSLGNSFFSQDAVSVMMDANKQFELTGGTTASRPTGVASAMYYNTSNNWFDFHNGTSWFNPARSATTNGLFTAGSVLFGGSAGTIQQDNASLFFDDTNNRLGIGTASPAFTLDVSTATAPNPIVRIYNTSTSTQNSQLYIRSAGTFATSNSSIEFQNAAGGTVALVGSTSAVYTNSAFPAFTANGTFFYGVNDYGMVAQNGRFAFQTGTGTSAVRMVITNPGLVGIGTTSPDRLLHPELSGSATNTVGITSRQTHITSGTATTGFGVGEEYEAENASGTNRVIGQQEAVYTTATNAAEVSDLVFRTMRAGTLTESLRSLGNGTLQVGTLSGTATQLVGATSGNILTAVTLGAGLSFSSGTLNGAFLPLTLTGTTEVNTAGQVLRIRDAGGYPDVYMNNNYWSVASDVNTFVDVGSTSGQIQLNSAGRTYIAAATNLELQSGLTNELRLDGDSLVLEGVYPVGTASDSVLVRDAATDRVKLVAQSDMEGVWLKTVLESGNNVDVLAVDQPAFEISDLAGFNILNATDINLEGGNTIELTTNNLTLVGNFPVGSSADSVLVQDASTGRVNVVPQVSEGAGIDISSGLVISTTQSFFNDYDASITLTAVTSTPDTLDADSNVKSNDWGFNPTTSTYTYNGTTGRYYSVSVSAQAEDVSGNGETLIIGVYRNNTLTSAVAQAGNPLGTAEPFALHGQAVLLLSNGDTINAKVSTSGASEDFNLLNYSLIIKEI